MGNFEKNKEDTKRRLISAVGEVFRSAGYQGLGVNKVARAAGVNKKLVYRYFGSFENLVEAYVVETDYWMILADKFIQVNRPHGRPDLKELNSDLLVTQYEYFKANREMQQLILWELSSDSSLMRSIHRTRELMSQKLFAMAEPQLNGGPVNFRAIAALLVGGIYYTILHARHNGSLFSGVELDTESGDTDMKQAIRFIVEAGF